MPSNARSAGAAGSSTLVAVLAFAGMGASFMQTILVPIQSQLPALLSAARDDTAWVITITLLVSSIVTPISGRLGDMYGKRRIALLLLAALILGSLVCALSYSVTPMIIGRALQGAGMGVIPLGISILRDNLPVQRLGGAIALVSATLGIGGALGLPISALVVEHFDWHALFWMAAAIGALSLILIFIHVPAGQGQPGQRFDWIGAITLSLGLTGLLLGVSKGNEWGWTSPLTLISIIGGIAVLALWIRFEWGHAQPLVDVRTSFMGAPLVTNIASIAIGFSLYAAMIAFPQLLQLPIEAGGLGVPLLQASLVLMPSGLAMLAMSPIAGRLLVRIGPKWLLVVGAAIIGLAYLSAVVLPPGILVVCLSNTIIGVGIGLSYAAMPSLVMRSVPISQTASANGLNTLMRSLGTAFAAAIVAAILSHSASAAGGIYPTEDGFRFSLLLGLIASVVGAILAALIPLKADKV
ncbi:MFS transporter [Devosia sp. SD17-2]|uniref:MFS transporter n=1 Tax=Devosia sp. SD17-2 TaxID=2976459 RepID=UPI0023D7CA08|nr:MFS transporter [Devosia sp. SD17-2]WEJ31389.1 MFS transporter [Devosia sp. SD17-2]